MASGHLELLPSNYCQLTGGSVDLARILNWLIVAGARRKWGKNKVIKVRSSLLAIKKRKTRIPIAGQA